MDSKKIQEIKAIKDPLKKGDAFFEARKYEDAVDSYLEALLQDTGDVSINMKLGEAYLKQGNYLEAKQTFEEIEKIKPDHVLVRNYLHRIDVQEIVEKGNHYRRINEYQKAIETYYKVFKINPNNVAALYGTALVFLEQKKIEKAINIFNKIIAMDSLYQEEYKHILNHMAMSISKQGMHDKAVALYQKAISLDSKDEALLFNLAAAYLRRQNYSEAKKLLNKALEIDPDFDEAKQLLDKLP